METYRNGALYVAEQPGDRNELQRELKRLDDRLFLELQVTLTHEQVWCVVLDATPPQTILEWRDSRGVPIPLSSGIVERVRRMVAQGDASGLAREAAERNHRMIEEARVRAREESRDIVLDILPSVLGHRSVMLPRGQSLRMARDKARARGEKR